MSASENVTFRKCGGVVFAIFPDIQADSWGNVLSYATIGQHGAASTDWLDDDPVSADEYSELLTELEGIYGQSYGHDDDSVDLIVVD